MVEAVHEVAAVECYRRLQGVDVTLGDTGLERLHVHPKISLGIKLNRLGIAVHAHFREATTDVPEGRRKRCTRSALRALSPEKPDQPIPRLWPVTMGDQVG